MRHKIFFKEVKTGKSNTASDKTAQICAMHTIIITWKSHNVSIVFTNINTESNIKVFTELDINIFYWFS
jgi:hypothetical protein